MGWKFKGDINHGLLQRFIGHLMTTKGPDLYRYKGLLSIKGAKERYVFQVGVAVCAAACAVSVGW